MFGRTLVKGHEIINSKSWIRKEATFHHLPYNSTTEFNNL